LQEREGTCRAAVGRVRVFFFDDDPRIEEEDPHPNPLPRRQERE
jgi:hypothetical protein